MSIHQPSETVELLRACAAQTSGPLHVAFEQLRDRPDLPAAAAELIRAGTEQERVVALLGLQQAASRGREAAEAAAIGLADVAPRVRIVAARTLGTIRWPGSGPVV